MHSVESSSGSSSSAPAAAAATADEALFDASEVRFLSDSLSSADTFDPFTIGAPGFKVPSLLPPLLGLDARGGEADQQQHQQAGVITPAAAAQLGRHASAALGLTSANGGSPWEDASRRPSLFDPTWLSNAARGASEQQQQSNNASGSGSNSNAAASSSSNNTTSSASKAYGRDRAWQMAQLDALKVEREKYLAASAELATNTSTQQPAPMYSSPPNLERHASGSLHGSPTGSFSAAGPSRNGSGYGLPPLPSLLHGPAHHPGYSVQDSTPSHPPGPHGEAYAAALARYKAIAAASSSGTSIYGGMLPPLVPHQQQQQQHQQPHQQQQQSHTAVSHDASAPQLGSLGLSFPSMHSFPAAPGMPGGPPLSGQPGVNGASRVRNADDASGDVQMSDVGRVAKVARTSVKEKSSKAKGKAKATTTSSAAPGASGSRPSSSMGHAPLDRQDSDTPAPSQPAPVPPLPSIDLHRALSSLPPELHATYLNESLDKLQPHLDQARAHRRAQRAINPDLFPRAASPTSAAAAAAAKKKAPHVLLTDAEKKANHIASEQKRRANIRKGYEVLCELVPSLREALGGDEEEAATAGGARAKKDWEVGGEKIDGRAGPRSESIVLLKTVEYLRERLEEHRELVLRRERARKQVAARFGVDISLASSAAGASNATDSMEH